MMQYPNMREELIWYLTGLSDPDYQERNWVKKECLKAGRDSGLDYAVDFLFDDTRLATNPSALIGVFLRNSEEAISLGILCNAIDTVFKKYGTHLSDEDYIGKPEWPDVVKKASDSLLLIKKFDEKAGD